jgi:1,4-alpha-glucan branching enzyme/plastocyanin
MKKALLLVAGVVLNLLATAQLIVTNPAIITSDYAGVIEVVFDASLGNAGLKDYTGTDVYAHTGVITNASTSDADWKHAPVWKDNSPKYLLSKLGNNKWKLLITPDMAGYYNLNTGEVVRKLAFVFRNSTATREGKDVGGKDIFVPVFQAGLHVSFSSPASDLTIAPGAELGFVVTSTVAANLELTINQQSMKTVASATSLSYAHTFSQAGDYEVVASATAGGVTVYDTLRVVALAPVVEEPRPAGSKPGITYNSSGSATLVLHAPNKQNVVVIGEFNNWLVKNAYQLKKDGEYWWITLDGLTPGYMYAFQYLVDGQLRISDPYTELVLDPWNDQWINYSTQRFPDLKPYPTGKTDGLVATLQTNKPAFHWEVPDFRMPDRENMIIYELLLRDFTVEKSLEATISKLDYLKKLGVTAVELMPVHEFDGNESWGYNPNHFFAPDKAYGTPEMYKRFVDECHKRGIAVILDVVFNHATGINPMAALYWNATTSQTASTNPWFNVTAPHPYSVFHDFNHSYAPTREYFKRVLQYWIGEYKIDGYRLDLTKGFTQKSSSESTASRYDQTRIDYLTEYYEAAKAVKPDVMFILEHFCDYDEELVLANRGMYLWRNVNNSFSQAAMGYSSGSDFGGLATSPRRWVGYSESHDEERNFYKAKAFGVGNVKTDSVYRISRVPLNIAFTVLVPGPKMLWQFQEMGYDYSIDALGGRTSNKPSAWGWLDLPHRKAAMEASAKLISLRSMFPAAFTNGTFQFNYSTSDWENGRRIVLSHNDLSLMVLGNFKADQTAVVFPNFPKGGLWHNVLTGEQKYIGYVNDPITLQPGQVVVFADRKIDFPSSVDQSPVAAQSIVYPTQTNDRIWISDESLAGEVKLYSLHGQLINSWQGMQEISLGAYPEGVYLLHMRGSAGIQTQKIIRKN